MSKPKIAILSIRNNYRFGGVLSTIKILHNFCTKFFDPTVFVLSFDKSISASCKSFKFSSSNRATTYAGMKYVEIGARWAFWEPGHYAFTLKQWKQALKGYDYFFPVVSTPIAAYPLVLLNKKFPIWLSTPYQDDRAQRVNSLQGIRALINKFSEPRMAIIEKKILQKANYLLALSSYSQKQFEKITPIPAHKISLCGTPVCIDQNDFKAQKKTKNIIAVGRYSDPRKNIDMLIRVFDKIYLSDKNATLTIIGKRPSLENLKRFKKLKSFHAVTFAGEQDNLNPWYKNATLMLITSYQEGFGIVGLEALAHGVPVVATKCGGVQDYVLHDKTGYLVEINQDDKMAEYALKILHSPDLIEKLTSHAVVHLTQYYSQEAIFSKFTQALCTVYPELKPYLTVKMPHRQQTGVL